MKELTSFAVTGPARESMASEAARAYAAVSNNKSQTMPGVFMKQTVMLLAGGRTRSDAAGKPAFIDTGQNRRAIRGNVCILV